MKLKSLLVVMMMMVVCLPQFGFAKISSAYYDAELFLLRMKPTDKPLTFEEAKKVMVDAAKRWNVDPSFLVAVAYIESRQLRWGHEVSEFRYGPIGKPVRNKRRQIICDGTYFGPMAIHYGSLSKWRIDDPRINIEVGARALRGVGDNKTLQLKRLRRYNTEFKGSYGKAVLGAARRFKEELTINGYIKE